MLAPDPGPSCIGVNGRGRGFHASILYILAILFPIEKCFDIIKENFFLDVLICFSSTFLLWFIVRLQPEGEI